MYVKALLTDEMKDSIRISMSLQPNKMSGEPVCDFCGDPHPTFVFRANKINPEIIKGWAACDSCSVAVDENDWDTIRERMITRVVEMAHEKGINNISRSMINGPQIDYAIQRFQETLLQLPSEEQQQLFAQAQEKLQEGDLEGVDELLVKAIRLQPETEVSSKAKEMRSGLAEKTFRSVPGGALRMDAVFYCLAALKKFAGMSDDDVMRVGSEVAVIGMKGLDINSNQRKYTLQTLDDMQVTGLQALCYEYVAFQQTNPELNIGFDLSKEYDTAKSMKQMGM